MSSLFFSFCSKTEQDARRQSCPEGKWNKKVRILKSIYLRLFTVHEHPRQTAKVYWDIFEELGYP